jgi:hypothetical protein
MRTRDYRFPLLLAVFAAAGLGPLASCPAPLSAAAPENKFEDWAQFHFSGGVVSATGIKDNGAFTVVPLETSEARTKVAVSFALMGETSHSRSDFQIVAVDAAGNRHEPKDQSKASAGGNGLSVVTFVLDFNLGSGKIDALLVQQRARE